MPQSSLLKYCWTNHPGLLKHGPSVQALRLWLHTKRFYVKTQLGLIVWLGLGMIACDSSPDRRIREASDLKIVDNSLQSVDLLADGPYTVEESLYDSGPRLDRDVLPPPPFDLPEVQTDIRGKIYLPIGSGPFPVIVYLHGNHGTCGTPSVPNGPRLDIGLDFTEQGSCPEGMVESPSYRGYEYSARHLASWGYAVVSINANRGITGRNGYDNWDWGLIYARGKLVLRTIEQLQAWAREDLVQAFSNHQVHIKDKLDWTEVGLMGHSRGGEGVRYAYNIYHASNESAVWQQRLPQLGIRGIFEIAPVDFGASGDASTEPMKIEAPGVAWTVLIPGCDNDVIDFSGSRPYARALDQQDSFPKAVFTVWGANHNFFNSEWQVSDAPHSCVGHQTPLWDTSTPTLPPPFDTYEPLAREHLTGSKAQQDFAKGLLAAFFRSHVGKQRALELGRVFDPQYRLPQQLNRLAPSTREFVRLQESLVLSRPGVDLQNPVPIGPLLLRSMQQRVQDDLKLQQVYWEAYAKDKGIERIETYLTPDSFFRPSLSLSSDTPLKEAFAYELRFPSDVATQGYWTIDLSLARRTPCYEYDVKLCPIDQTDMDLSLALVLSDGRVTPSVQLRDYVQIKNWHPQYFEVMQADPLPSRGEAYALGLGFIQPLFQTARFELTDFQMPIDSIRGIKITFPADETVSLLLDEIRLVKQPLRFAKRSASASS
jgi:hypothetical protein